VRGDVTPNPSGGFVAHHVCVLTLRGDQVKELAAFLTPEVFRRFGLPDAIKPSPHV
jgi:hypothetical protein